MGVDTVVLVLEGRQREATGARADEGVVATVSEAVADEVPRDGADARVE